MIFSSLRFASFRNLRDCEIDTDAKDVFLIGENGQGKTNFLEGVYFCSYASSFRQANDRDLVHDEEIAHNVMPSEPEEEIPAINGCSVRGCFALAANREPDAYVPYKKILVKIENGRKSVLVDRKKIEDRKELIQIAPCVVFCHEDMVFAAGTPEDRRWFFDQSISLGDPVYLDDLRNYRKVLKSRNILLKDRAAGMSINEEMLDVLDPQLAQYGANVMKKRSDAAKLFSETFTSLYARVSGMDNVEIHYRPSWKEADTGAIATALEKRRDADSAFGATLTGPHRDRYVFTKDGAEFARNASTGQRRLLVLLLRAAEARRFSLMSGKKPVLLLDDVLLELDPEKRRRFLEILPDYDQAFYTFLPEEPYERYRKTDSSALVYNVSGGVLERR